MADVTLTYKGNTILELNDSAEKSIKTAGKYLEDDIGLSYVKSGSGGTIILSGVSAPTTSQGSIGDIYLQYFEAAALLPSGYTAVEYITFSGNQYFNTGISANTTNLRVVTDLAVMTVDTEAFWGGEWSENGFFLMAYNGKFRWHSGGKSIDSLTISTGQWYSIETNKSAIIINGTTYALTSPSGSDSSYNLSIGTTTSGSQGSKAKMMMKRTKVYSGTTLLADYIPALDANNVACFYDTVGESTIYSAGAAFSAGADATDGEILAAYLRVNGAWQGLVGSNINDVNT